MRGISSGILAERPRNIRTTLGTYFDRAGVMRIARAGFLRPKYVYLNGVWTQNGWLRESEATNAISSLVFTNNYGITVSNSKDDRFPEQNVVFCTVNSSAQNQAWRATWAIPFFQSCTASIFFKLLDYGKTTGKTLSMWITPSNGYNPSFNVNKDGSITQVNSDITIENYGEGLYRLSVTNSSDATGFKVGSTLPVSGFKFIIAMPQVESGNIATSPIPNSGSPVTRTKD